MELKNSYANKIVTHIAQALKSKEEVIAITLGSFFVNGHVLLEDVPGVGKTTLAHALAATLGLPYNRIQCTSDLLPSDITGMSIWNPKENAFTFHEGPVFTNILLADEINRASNKTQSALLEAMEEGYVSIDRKRHALPDPFWVIATQNPEDPGTNILPQSQLDRFLIKISLGYPDGDAEKQMLKRSIANKRGPLLDSIGIDIRRIKTAIDEVIVSEACIDYVYALLSATRTHVDIKMGLSPRAGIGLMGLARAWAWMDNREYVLPNDIKHVFPYVAGHRILAHGNEQRIIREILQNTPCLN